MKTLWIWLLWAWTVGSEVARRLVGVHSNTALSHKAGTNLRLNSIFTRNPQWGKSQDIHTNHSGIFRDSPEEVIWSQDIQIIIETMWGTEEALRVIELALRAWKHVVTANKDLLSLEWARLLKLARENNVNIGVEAAVMWWIPIIKALTDWLAGDEIRRIVGIANGTSNYILTEMKKRNLTYEEALKEAQELGYAERDPTNDVKWPDAAYKLSLLAFIAFWKDVKIWDFNQVEGIDALDAIDFRYLEELKSKVKLLAIAEKTRDGTLTLMVAPHVLDIDHPLAQVDGALNAVEISGLAEWAPNFLRGKWAGNIPTSNSILSDVVNIARGRGKIWIPEEWQHMQLTKPEDITGEYYLRVTTSEDVPWILGKVATCLWQYGINIEQTRQIRWTDWTWLNIPFVITTGITDQATMKKVVEEIRGMENIGWVVSMRML